MASSPPLILIVDDNKDILFHLRLILEDNRFRVESATSGANALEILSELKEPPDLIISDIMMPEMDGYELFIELSSHPLWNRIPFIFLTAKSTPEDIRIGKKLGVDDYLTKPPNHDDLLAIIQGKLGRSKRSTLMDNRVKELLTNLNVRIEPSIAEDEKSEILLFLMEWDDKLGPDLVSCCEIEEDLPFSPKQVGIQLFYSANSIYGQGTVTKAEGILLNIDNIKKQSYAYFDAYPDDSMRAREKQFMLVVIAPRINYLESLLIKDVFKQISRLIRQKIEWDINDYWEKIVKILTEPVL